MSLRPAVPSPDLRSPSPARGEGRKEEREESVPLMPKPRWGEDRKVPNNCMLSPQLSPLAGEGDRRSGEGAAGYTLRFAKHLRRNMTDAETKLWQELRAKRFEHYKFKRQQPIGKYIVDFVCLSRRLIVEIDGSQHEGSHSDVVRDAWLTAQGFRILRLWNSELLSNTDGALLSVLAALQESKQ
jgi:very-short-patch-repair endonuclease